MCHEAPPQGEQVIQFDIYDTCRAATGWRLVLRGKQALLVASGQKPLPVQVLPFNLQGTYVLAVKLKGASRKWYEIEGTDLIQRQARDVAGRCKELGTPLHRFIIEQFPDGGGENPSAGDSAPVKRPARGKGAPRTSRRVRHSATGRRHNAVRRRGHRTVRKGRGRGKKRQIRPWNPPEGVCIRVMPDGIALRTGKESLPLTVRYGEGTDSLLRALARKPKLTPAEVMKCIRLRKSREYRKSSKPNHFVRNANLQLFPRLRKYCPDIPQDVIRFENGSYSACLPVE